MLSRRSAFWTAWATEASVITDGDTGSASGSTLPSPTRRAHLTIVVPPWGDTLQPPPHSPPFHTKHRRRRAGDPTRERNAVAVEDSAQYVVNTLHRAVQSHLSGRSVERLGVLVLRACLSDQRRNGWRVMTKNGSMSRWRACRSPHIGPDLKAEGLLSHCPLAGGDYASSSFKTIQHSSPPT